ncbi:MAG: YbjN domain-containing protein [Actinomycetota bacterium]|nr:YbjN domain-containing protein [Actinomycetota bacterium]
MIPRPALEHHVKRMLMHDMELTYVDVQEDQDGDFGVSTDDGVRVYARLIYDAAQVWVRLWTEAAHGLRPTVKLLREVNEINRHHVGCRVLLTEDGTLVVAAEVRAESVEHGELGTLVGILSDTVVEIGELIQIVYGVAAPSPNDASRSAGTN